MKTKSGELHFVIALLLFGYGCGGKTLLSPHGQPDRSETRIDSGSNTFVDAGTSHILDTGISDRPDAAVEPDAGTSDLDISWQPCTAGIRTTAECALIQVPLRWENPDDRAITLSLKRVRRSGNRGQLWLLQGGPGGFRHGL